MANPNVQVQNQIKRLGDKEFFTNAGSVIPFFFEEKLDTITAKQFLDQITIGLTNGFVTQAEVMQRMPTYLKGQAKKWYDMKINLNSLPATWDLFRTEFAKKFRVILNNDIATENINDLKMRTTETCSEFSHRVHEAVAGFYETLPKLQPENFQIPQATIATIGDAVVEQAIKDAVTALVARTETAVSQGHKQATMRNQFVNGLLPKLKNKIRSLPIVSFEATIELAEREELLNKGNSATVASVETTDEEMIAALAQYRRQGSQQSKYQQGPKAQGQKQQQNTTSQSASGPTQFRGSNAMQNVKCWFCKRMGHFQSKCVTRITQNKPLVNKKNKVFSIDGTPVIPEDGLTPETLCILKEAKLQGYCNSDEDFLSRE